MNGPAARFWFSLTLLWLLLALVHLLDWRLGFHRGVALITVLCFFLARWSGEQDGPTSPAMHRLLLFAFAALFVIACGALIYGLRHATPLDIGESTVRSIKALLQNHSNPYATIVDEDQARHSGYFLEGYKYLPLAFLIYMPAVWLIGMNGIYVTNFVFFCATLCVLYRVALHFHRAGQLDEPLLPVVLYMSSFTVLLETFDRGVNDGVVIFFGLASLLAVFKEYDKWPAPLNWIHLLS